MTTLLLSLEEEEENDGEDVQTQGPSEWKHKDMQHA